MTRQTFLILGYVKITEKMGIYHRTANRLIYISNKIKPELMGIRV